MEEDLTIIWRSKCTPSKRGAVVEEFPSSEMSRIEIHAETVILTMPHQDEGIARPLVCGRIPLLQGKRSPSYPALTGRLCPT